MNFSKEFIERYTKELYYVNCAIFNAVLTDYQPCHWKTYWSKNSDKYNLSVKKLACSYGYKDGWIGATRYQQDTSLGLLIFSGQKVDADPRTRSIIKYITPHFAESIKATFHSSIIRCKQKAHYKITPRELEVLKWITEGKSSWDISTILNRSERVVIWHADNIKKKLDAQNRAHAVAIAMRHRLID
jgi:DNA-binding CsgD family transcriptional regulator